LERHAGALPELPKKSGLGDFQEDIRSLKIQERQFASLSEADILAFEAI
jgi:hypothetical protein